MQLRKLIRILKDIEKVHGGHLSVTVQAKDFHGSPFSYHKFDSVGTSECYFEKEDGFLAENPQVVVSLGLESPNLKEYK